MQSSHPMAAMQMLLTQCCYKFLRDDSVRVPVTAGPTLY